MRALECEPGVADAYDGLAHVSMLLGRHERSNALYRRRVAPPDTRASGTTSPRASEVSAGSTEAQAACERAIALDPTQYPSYLLRSELRVQTPGANHVEELRRSSRAPRIEDRARMFLGYALGKELDDLERFDEAFPWFLPRRTHAQAQLPTTSPSMSASCSGSRKCIRARSVRRGRPGAVDSSRYLFIVGLPRSGTTLVERILTGLAGVRSNGETDHFSRALARGLAGGRQGRLRARAAADPDAVAANYASARGRPDTRGRSSRSCRMNYLYLGAIHRALPDARLILVQPLAARQLLRHVPYAVRRGVSIQL